MKLSDIKTLVKSIPIILAVALYLIFKPDAQQANITVDDAVALTNNELYDVTYVEASDGDTITVEVDGKKERVRLLLVDAPEMNYKEKNPQQYAEEAKQFTIDLLKDAKSVQLLHDVGDKKDHYDRLLAYVFVDGVLLQERLLQEGYAAVRYKYEPNTSLEAQLYAIQDEAKAAKVNIWSIDGYFDEKEGFQQSAIK